MCNECIVNNILIVFLDTLSEHYSPETLLALLQTSVAQLEEHSEVIILFH